MSSKEAFDVAVKEVQTAGEWSKAITTDRKLLCYAFYKQAMQGDVTGEQPWAGLAPGAVNTQLRRTLTRLEVQFGL